MVFLVFFRYENTRIWLDFNYQMQNAKYEMQIRVQHTHTHTFCNWNENVFWEKRKNTQKQVECMKLK